MRRSHDAAVLACVVRMFVNPSLHHMLGTELQDLCRVMVDEGDCMKKRHVGCFGEVSTGARSRLYTTCVASSGSIW